MGASVRLDQYATATFDANGRAVAVLPSVPQWRRWTVNVTAISTTSALRSACQTFRGNESASNLIDTSSLGGNADTSDTVFTLEPGEYLTAVWTTGTPGATATCRIVGTDDPA